MTESPYDSSNNGSPIPRVIGSGDVVTSIGTGSEPKKPLKKFKSQSVNNLFKQNQPLQPANSPGGAGRDAHSMNSVHLHSHSSGSSSVSNSLNNHQSSAFGSASVIGQNSLQAAGLQPANRSSIKTLSLATGPKLKIIPEKRLATPLGQGNGTGGAASGSPFTSKLIKDENNYWKKSRSASPETKLDIKAKEPAAAAAATAATAQPAAVVSEQQPKKTEGSRFTFSNLSLPPTSGFNWADIDDEEDESFNDKIWSSLASSHVDFPVSSNSNNARTGNSDLLSSSLHIQAAPLSQPPQPAQGQQNPASMISPPLDSSEILSPLRDSIRTQTNNWNNTSPLLGFRRHTSSTLSFNDSNKGIQTIQASGNDHHPDTTNYFNNQNHSFHHQYGGALSSSFEKLSFADSGAAHRLTGSEPVKQELFNPVTGKIEVFTTAPATDLEHNNNHNHSNLKQHPAAPTHHHSFDSSYINHNAASNKADFWKTSSTVWNSRENSLTNTLPTDGFTAFSPNLNDPVSSPGWSTNLESRNNSDSLIDAAQTTPNTLRGASRFFPSPMTEQNTDYFAQQLPQQQLKRQSSDSFDPLSVTSQSQTHLPATKASLLKQQQPAPAPAPAPAAAGAAAPLLRSRVPPGEPEPNYLITRSAPTFEENDEEVSDEEEITIQLPAVKANMEISDSKRSIEQLVLTETVKHPEGFSSTFYKRGVNSFMFVRELQSKVAINKIRGYDYAEFRINIPISRTSMAKLIANQDPDQPNRIKRSYIINIDVKELEGKFLRKPAPSGVGNGGGAVANSPRITNSGTTYTRPGYNGNSNSREHNSRRGSNVYIRKGT